MGGNEGELGPVLSIVPGEEAISGERIKALRLAEHHKTNSVAFGTDGPASCWDADGILDDSDVQPDFVCGTEWNKFHRPFRALCFLYCLIRVHILL